MSEHPTAIPYFMAADMGREAINDAKTHGIDIAFRMADITLFDQYLDILHEQKDQLTEKAFSDHLMSCAAFLVIVAAEQEVPVVWQVDFSETGQQTFPLDQMSVLRRA